MPTWPAVRTCPVAGLSYTSGCVRAPAYY